MIFGKRHYKEWPLYYQDIKDLKGNIWLLYSHISPFGSEKNEKTYMINDIISENRKILVKKEFNGTSIYKIKF